MFLRYLVANAAYVFTFGDSIIPMDGVRFHDTREDAVRRAASVGLVVARDGSVSVAA